jgi:hypothetical protein
MGEASSKVEKHSTFVSFMILYNNISSEFPDKELSDLMVVLPAIEETFRLSRSFTLSSLSWTSHLSSLSALLSLLSLSLVSSVSMISKSLSSLTLLTSAAFL